MYHLFKQSASRLTALKVKKTKEIIMKIQLKQFRFGQEGGNKGLSRCIWLLKTKLGVP